MANGELNETFLKNLETRLQNLDKVLVSAYDDTGNLKKMLTSLGKEGGMSLKEIESAYSFLKTKVSDLKFKVILDGNDAKHTISELKQNVEGLRKVANSARGEDRISAIEKYKQAVAELAVARMSEKEQLEYILNIIHRINVEQSKGKTAEGTIYGKAQGHIIEDVRKAREEIIKLQEKQRSLQEAINRAEQNTSGSATWDGKRRSLEYLNNELEKTNNLIAQQNAVLQSGGERGKATARALGLGDKQAADLKKQAEVEREQIALLRQRNKLEEINLRLQTNLNNATLANKATPRFTAQTTQQIEANERRINEIRQQSLTSYENFSQNSLRRIEELRTQHENNLTNIVANGELARQRIVERETTTPKRGLSEEERAKRSQERIEEARQKSQIRQEESEKRAELRRQERNEREVANKQKAEERKTEIAEREARKRAAAEEKAMRRFAEAKELETLVSKYKQATAYAERYKKSIDELRNRQAQRTTGNIVISPAKAEQEQRVLRYLEERLSRTASEADKLRAKLASTGSGRSALRTLGTDAERAERSIRKLQGAASNLATAFASLFGLNQIRRFVGEVVKVRGEFEMTEVALRNIIGSEVQSQQIWKKTLALAVNSPFTAQQLLQSTKQLAAFRIETSKLYDTTKMLADVSIGLGVDVQRLILAYGHTKASGFLRGMYARQFATAGVNIYGELADYYTKLEGKLVSFRDVYERISKKLVTFADVEAVFEKITSKGGQFYNMQEILSNTVQGQINKIKDTWQQAMNDIGKSQTGLIRGVVSAILGIIKNWRTWLSVIESTTAAIIIFKGVQLASVMLGIAASTETAGRATTALARGLKRLAAAIAANPFALAAASIAALAIGIGTAVKHMNDFNKSIDENNLTLYNARQSILNYEERLQANNQIIEDYKNGVTKGEEAQTAMSNAQAENATIVAELQSKYPEYTENLKQNKDGIVELTEELQAYNQELQIQIALQNQFKQGNLFNQGLGQDSDQFFTRLEKDLLRVQSTIGEFKMQLANLGIDEKDLPQELRELVNIDFGNPEKAIEEYNQKIISARVALNKKIEEIDQKYNAQYYRQQNQAARQLGGSGLSVIANTSLGIQKQDITQTKEYQEVIKQFAGAMDLFTSSVNTSAHAYEEFNREFQQGNKFENGIQTEFSLAQTMARSTATELLAEIENLPEKERDAYNELIKQEGNIYAVMLRHHTKIEDDIRKGIIHANDATRSTLIEQGKATNKSRQNVLNERLAMELAYLAAEQKLQATAQQLAAEESKKATRQDKELISNLKKELSDAAKEYQGVFDWFTEQTSKTNQGVEGGENGKGKKTASKLISLIREMRAEYDKLSKSAYGYAKSEDTVRKSYEKAVETILGKAGVTKDYDFTTNEGMIAALEKVKAYADKLGPEAAAEVEKYIGQLKSEIELNVQVKVRDDFNRDLEKMFSNYELTLELQGLNIPEGMAKDLFPDLDYTTLGEIQDRMRKFYEEQRNANGEVLFDKDDLETYRKWADKVDAEILKSRKEKAKQYSKYLEKEYSDRAKLEMQHAKYVAFVTANVSDETQRQNIITQIDKKYQDDLNELHWKSFKESSFYVEMMDDISSLPKEYMQMMLDKIEEILQHPETLSPRALKEAINARQKVLEAQMNLEPLDVMRSSLKKIREAMSDDSVGGQTMRQTRENLDAQIAKTQELINEQEDEARCWDETAAAMQIYENAQHEVANAYGKLDAETRKLIQNNGVLFELTGRETEKNRNQQQIEENQRILDELNKKQRDGVQLTESEQNQLSGLKDQNATLEARNRALESQIALLNELITKEKELATIRGQQVGTDAEMQRGEGGVGTAAEARNRAQESKAEADNLEKANQKLKAWKKSFKDFADSMEKWNASVANMINKVSAMGNAFYDTFDALGGETNALTEGWREFGNTMTQTITSALNLIPQLVTGFITAGSSINAAMGVIGLIAEAIQLVLVAVGAIAKLHDAHYEREIEIQQKKIDDLRDAYARLERQIEQTFTTSSYMREFNEQIENLREQMAALEAQRSAESSKKNADADRVREYTNAIIEAQDEIDELGQRQIEVFGGIGKDNYRSWAEGFVDAWKDAFLETGDGLDALQDHFDEFLQEWFVKQATMRIAGNALEGVMSDIDRVVSDNGVVDWAELQRIKDQMDLILPDLNDKLTAFAGMWDFGGEGGLSGLAAGIQGMTEEQANVLEAYWNSVRMYTASIDGNVSRIAEMLGANGVESNPMLQQMSLIAANTQATHQLLQTVVKSGHPQGGYGIKVFND